MSMSKVKAAVASVMLMTVLGAGAFAYRADGREPTRKADPPAREVRDAPKDKGAESVEDLKRKLEEALRLAADREALLRAEADRARAAAERAEVAAKALEVERARAQAEAVALRDQLRAQEAALKAAREEAAALAEGKGAEADAVAALKALRTAKDKEARLRAVQALQKAVNRLLDELK
jgi:hypothetical protein